MSRSGYTDECDGWELICWRGAVASAIRGRRGQAFLRELLAALDAMPEKYLISDELRDEHGDVCALGAVCVKRGLEVAAIDYEDRDCVANALGIATALAAEIMNENDDGYWSGYDWRKETAEQAIAKGRKRWERMRAWVEKHIRAVAP